MKIIHKNFRYKGFNIRGIGISIGSFHLIKIKTKSKNYKSITKEKFATLQLFNKELENLENLEKESIDIISKNVISKENSV